MFLTIYKHFLQNDLLINELGLKKTKKKKETLVVRLFKLCPNGKQ